MLSPFTKKIKGDNNADTGGVAYAGNARNAVHLASIIVYSLEQISWDEGSDDFPGTGLQVTYINSGEFTDNIIPGRCEICFNIRYSHRYSLADIQAKVTERLMGLPVAEDTLLTLDIKWDRHCEPYFTQDNKQDSLITKAESAIHAVTGSFPRLGIVPK
ncbi:MAG: succinyl-diaminopimelate desuccinylase [Shewanella sp.]|nr:succinyl-diaminopimelate desuccinylase [Shewanella sp.]